MLDCLPGRVFDRPLSKKRLLLQEGLQRQDRTHENKAQDETGQPECDQAEDIWKCSENRQGIQYNDEPERQKVEGGEERGRKATGDDIEVWDSGEESRSGQELIK